MAREIAHITMAMAVIIVQTVMMMPLGCAAAALPKAARVTAETKAPLPLPPPISR